MPDSTPTPPPLDGGANGDHGNGDEGGSASSDLGGVPSGSSGGSTGLTRKERREQASKGSTTWWWVLGAVGLLAVILVVAVVATAGHAKKKAAATTTTTAAPPATTLPVTCPLTGAPAPGGTVPGRPALAVKIGNYSGDRPSAGLNQADIVFEEPVEGAYTRLVAVFQCTGSDLVGDLRSARQPDAAILAQLSNPLFFHAGGIQPVLDLLGTVPVQDKNVLDSASSSVVIHPAGRYAPYATFMATGPAWALAGADVTPPAPIFTYSAALPPGAAIGSGQSVHIPFSTDADVTWTWNTASGTYLRSYATGPDTLVGGGQTATSNVVAMTVPTAVGTWVENAQGGREIEVNAIGSGPVVVLRNGVATSGTWTRTSLSTPATFVDASGQPITLAPGGTWEELVPQGIPVTATAAPPPPATSTTTTSASKSSTSKTTGR